MIYRRFRLRDLLRYNLKTVLAHLLKQAFQQLWDSNYVTSVGKFLDEWCRRVSRADEEGSPLLCKHRELILNYFRAQQLLSTRVVEGAQQQSQL